MIRLLVIWARPFAFDKYEAAQLIPSVEAAMTALENKDGLRIHEGFRCRVEVWYGYGCVPNAGSRCSRLMGSCAVFGPSRTTVDALTGHNNLAIRRQNPYAEL